MSKLRYFVMDVDGTLTDGKIYMGADGEIMKAFNIKDGYAIGAILPSIDIVPVIITARNSEIVTNRCKELKVKYFFQGITDKLDKLIEIVGGEEALSEVAYIGDDINDLSCMKAVKQQGGLVGCPADAVKDVRKVADFKSVLCGGYGAVREFVEFISEY